MLVFSQFTPLNFDVMEKSFIKLCVFICYNLFGESVFWPDMSYVQCKPGLVMQVPFQDEQITDSILYPYHICDFPTLLMMATVLMFCMLRFFFLSIFPFFAFIHSFIHSICQVVGFSIGTLSGTVCTVRHSLPFTRHIKKNTHISFKWRYFHILLSSGCLSLSPFQWRVKLTVTIYHAMQIMHISWNSNNQKKNGITPEHHWLVRWICFGKLVSFIVHIEVDAVF